MEMTINAKLQQFIEAELKDSALYKELSIHAPSEEERRLLLEFSEDEKEHAVTFQSIYRTMSGQNYTPEIPAAVLRGTYVEILRERILDESGDFRKYGRQYLLSTRNQTLKEAFYKAQTDENVHALRILYILGRYSLTDY